VSFETVTKGVSMNTFNHTPGPWACNMSFGNWHIRQDPANWDGRGYQGICTAPAAPKNTQQGDMFKANARLITASPDLLDALQDLLNAHAVPSSVCKERPAYEKALAAIDKAVAGAAT
jgi:hypothetical protein